MKERYLIYKLPNGLERSSADEIPTALDLSPSTLNNAPDPRSKPKTQEKRGAEIITTRNVKESNDPEYGTVLEFGGEKTRIAITGEDVHILLSVESATNAADHIYVLANDKTSYPVIWDKYKNQYTYSDGPFKGKKVIFMNNNQYKIILNKKNNIKTSFPRVDQALETLGLSDPDRFLSKLKLGQKHNLHLNSKKNIR